MRILTLDDMEERQRVFARWYAGLEHHQAKTADEAIMALRGPQYDIVQLDHDLAEEHYLKLSEGLSEEGPIDYLGVCGTGMDVVDFICACQEHQRPKLVIVHSWNLVRSPEMVLRLQEHGVKAYWCKFDPNVPVPELLTRLGLW